jgi:hypothetical protein
MTSAAESSVKYPRTKHLPWSEGVSSDDVVTSSLSSLDGRDVVVTEKIDGENTTLYRDHMHARSIDSRNHPSRDWVKGLWSSIAHQIPDGWRICGENAYARHSIAYDALPSYFLGFSVWDERNRCLAWDDTVEFMELLGIEPVPVLWRGTFDSSDPKIMAVIRGLWTPDRSEVMEGYVVRDAASFAYEEFGERVAKFVRPNHVTTDQHWTKGPVIPNGLLSEQRHKASP